MKNKNDEIIGLDGSAQDYQSLKELGEYYFSIGNYAQSKRCYEKTAVLMPDESDSYIGLGVIALQNGLLDDAEIAFRIACRLNHNCARGYVGLAMVAQGKGDYSWAFDMYLKCLELDAENMTAILGLFQTSCQMGSFAKVVHYLELYLSTHPKDTSVMFSLAALHVKENRLEKAREILLDVLTSDSTNKDAANLLEEVEHNLSHVAPLGG